MSNTDPDNIDQPNPSTLRFILGLVFDMAVCLFAFASMYFIMIVALGWV